MIAGLGDLENELVFAVDQMPRDVEGEFVPHPFMYADRLSVERDLAKVADGLAAQKVKLEAFFQREGPPQGEISAEVFPLRKSLHGAGNFRGESFAVQFGLPGAAEI